MSLAEQYTNEIYKTGEDVLKGKATKVFKSIDGDGRLNDDSRSGAAIAYTRVRLRSSIATVDPGAYQNFSRHFLQTNGEGNVQD